MDHCAKCCLVALPLPLGGYWAAAISEHLLCAGPVLVSSVKADPSSDATRGSASSPVCRWGN